MSQYLSRSKIRYFESALEKLGRILAEKYKIRVVFKHDACMTDGRTIYLPVIPDNASQEFLSAVQGFLDHEVAHVIFSDFGSLQSLESKDRKKWNIVQALEDGRVESEMRKLWRGAGVNLASCSDWALKQLKERWSELSPFGKLCQGMAVLGCSGSDHWFTEDVLKKEAEIWPKLQQVAGLIEQAKGFSSTQEVIDHAATIMKVLQEKEEEDEEDVPPPLQPPPSADGDEGEEDEEEEVDGDEEDGEEEEDGNSDEEDEEDGEADGEEDREENTDVMDATDSEMEQDEQLRSRSNMIRDACKQDVAQEDRYFIYTTEDDTMVRIEDGDRVQSAEFLRQSRAMVNVLLKRMRLNLLSSRQDRWESGKRRGKIDPRAAFRVPIGTSKRVFRQRVVAPSFNTRASLWVDHSGSMQGYKVDLAAKAAILFGEVLHELGIPFEICGYSTRDYDKGVERYNRATPEEKKVFTRWGDLWVGVYKSFDEDWRHVKHRCIQMSRNSMANTYDAESIRLAASRLIQFPETRKILFVFNDGYPQPNVSRCTSDHTRYLKEVVKQLENIVELFAVGICSPHVKDYYSNSVEISAVEDLPKVMLEQLDTMLRKGKRLTTRKVA